MSSPPSHEPEIQTSRSSEESEQLRNLIDLVPRLESRVELLEKELSDTKQTLGTAVLKLIKKIKSEDKVGVEEKRRKLWMKRMQRILQDCLKGLVKYGSTPTAQVNTGSTPTAQVNPARVNTAELNTDQILAEKLQQEEREQYSIEDRAKFLHDTIAAQRKFLAEQRSATFVAIGSEEDERAIKKMNEQAVDKENEQKAESIHEEIKEAEGAKKRKLGKLLEEFGDSDDDDLVKSDHEEGEKVRLECYEDLLLSRFEDLKIFYFEDRNSRQSSKAQSEAKEFSNALADLGASISLMPLSLYKRLGIRKLEPCNMFIFPVDFVILDMVEDPRMPIILGRPLLATAHASVDIFRKSISLEVGNEKVIFKMRSTFTSTFESIRSIKTIENAEENDILNIKDDIFLYEACEYNELLKIKPDIFSYEINIQESYDANYRIMREMSVRTHWCEPITQFKNNKHHYWPSCDPYGEVCDGGDNIASENRNYWKSTNDNERNNLIWEGMSSKDWIRVKYAKICKNTQDKIIRDYWRDEMEKEKEDNLEIQEEYSSDDEEDLIGILDYLEPNSYNGFTNCENESYNKRKCELLGMTYTKAPPIIIEKAEITRYILGPDESYTKVKILEIDGLLRTQENVADIRAKIVSKVHNNNKT
ncbi:hypothetical protein Tco_0105881 [Tanacetum coccineum]